ncbi:ketopantoate reductase family protein [Blastococcus haudaquaticus]|uniref:2-dehydropantoate 2-reductase n=1 Tax=Blastococcus haudaquaticus TaxID=1938745 RepID=A0A286GXA7_9ACTN|nr:2-dehydropantoate 2-reductase [Blastococcus haudaquaticus]SOE00175.1 2-dehydropantoate 2-reductase [Blastococcus haudaquaticus]
MSTLRVAVLGPGGVGGLLGTLLARQGHAVTCLARPDTAAHIERHGLRLDSDRYGEVTAPASGAEVLTHPVDVVLVTPKATRLTEALERVPAPVLGEAVVVPLLNGVEHMDVLRRRYPDARVVAGAIRVVASRPAPGVARHEGTLAAVELAPGAEALADALADAGLDVTVRPDEAGLLWAKLAFLAPVALLTTTLDAPLGAVREQLGDDLRALVEEVAAVARAEGAPADAAATLAFMETVPAAMTSSLQRDTAAGHETELEAIGGAVLRAAARHGVDVPVTTRVVEHLRAQPA